MMNWDLSALDFLHPERGGFGMDIAPDAVERKQRMFADAFHHLPVGDAILHVAGENHPLFEQQIAHPTADDPHWAPSSSDASSASRYRPCSSTAGSTPRSRACATTSSRSAPTGRPRDAHRWWRPPRRRGKGGADAALAWFDRTCSVTRRSTWARR